MLSFNSYFRLLVFLTPLIPSYLGFRVGGALVNGQRLFFLVAIVSSIFVLLSRPRVASFFLKTLRVNRPLVVCAGAILVLRMLSSILGVDPATSLKTAVYEVIFYPFLFVATVVYCKDFNEILALPKLIVKAMLIVSVVAIVERALELNLIAYLGIGFDPGDEYLSEALTAKIRNEYRAQSTFYNPLSLGHYLITFLPFLICMHFRNGRLDRKAGFILGATLVLLAILSTGSRAALLIFGVLILAGAAKLAQAWSRRPSRKYRKYAFAIRAVGVFALILFAAGAMVLIVGSGEEEADSSMARLAQLAIGMNVVADHPVLGVGTKMALEMAGTSLDSERVSIDNFYLSLAIDNGIPVLALFLAMSFILLKWSSVLFRQSPYPWSVLAVAVNLSVLAFFTFLLISSLYEEVFPLFAVLCGILCSVRAHEKFGFGSGRVDQRSLSGRHRYVGMGNIVSDADKRQES